MFRIEVIGNIGADAVKRTDNGRDFFTFKVAHTEVWEDCSNQKHEQTIWVSCILNDRIGAAVASYLTKGRRVYVRGRGYLRTYSSRIDRCIKAGCSISVDELELLGGQVDEVPRRLADPVSGVVVDVHRAYFVAQTDFPNGQAFHELVSEKGVKYAVDPQGYLYKRTDSGDTENVE